MSTTRTSIQQLTDGSPAGAQLGRSDDLIALYGKTPIAQQTAPTAVDGGTAVQAGGSTGSTSTVIASLQSQALATASLANAMRQDMIDLGIYV